MTDLARLKMLVEKATPGDWTLNRLAEPNEGEFVLISELGLNEQGVQQIRSIGRLFRYADFDQREANAELLAQSKTLARSLLAAKEEIDRLRAALTRIEKMEPDVAHGDGSLMWAEYASDVKAAANFAALATLTLDMAKPATKENGR